MRQRAYQGHHTIGWISCVVSRMSVRAGGSSNLSCVDLCAAKGTLKIEPAAWSMLVPGAEVGCCSLWKQPRSPMYGIWEGTETLGCSHCVCVCAKLFFV